MPEISVILPCYNAAAFLEPCLESVMRQSLRDIEILVVDDGSLDDTRAVAQRLAATDSRITVLEQTHTGPGAARNRGLAASRAPYIAFVDSDDFLPHDACSTLLEAARESGADLLVGTTEGHAAAAAGISGTSRVRAIAALFTGRLSMSVFAKLYRRPFLAEHDIRFPPEVYIEDRHFLLQCLVGGARLASLEHVVYRRQIRPESTMHQVGAKHVTDTTAVYRLDTALLASAGLLGACGRHVAWATLAVDLFLARALARVNGGLRELLASEIEAQEDLFRLLPGARLRSALLATTAGRLRRAVARGDTLGRAGTELALLKVLVR